MALSQSFFMFAGEPSGDLHGSHLLAALKRKLPHYAFHGVGGPLMRNEGLDCVMAMEKFAVMGFSDVLRSLPKLVKQFYQVRNAILKQNPEVVIFIDYPGFNLRMAKALRKKGYKGKLVHYICPTVWAWGKKRIKQMNKTLDLLLTIYPFEEDCFAHTTLKVLYVGNPVKEEILEHAYNHNWYQELGLESKDNLIALFPGSRKAEIERNLPKQLQALQIFKQEHPSATFAISCANQESTQLIQGMVDRSVKLVPIQFRYELMRDCDTAIAKSGTVTLELALHKRPSVVVYEVSKLNRFIARYLIRLKLHYFCIVNILLGKEVFPELIKEPYTPQLLADTLHSLYQKGIKRDGCIENCTKLDALLQEKRPSEQASRAILELLKC
jgi:lipid-A-disaccharide synthase